MLNLDQHQVFEIYNDIQTFIGRMDLLYHILRKEYLELAKKRQEEAPFLKRKKIKKTTEMTYLRLGELHRNSETLTANIEKICATFFKEHKILYDTFSTLEYTHSPMYFKVSHEITIIHDLIKRISPFLERCINQHYTAILKQLEKVPPNKTFRDQLWEEFFRKHKHSYLYEVDCFVLFLFPHNKILFDIILPILKKAEG